MNSSECLLGVLRPAFEAIPEEVVHHGTEPTAPARSRGSRKYPARRHRFAQIEAKQDRPVTQMIRQCKESGYVSEFAPGTHGQAQFSRLIFDPLGCLMFFVRTCL